jgi:putative effector of murein hydrolase
MQYCLVFDFLLISVFNSYHVHILYTFLQIMKCLFVVVFGFYFSASTTAYTVLAIRKMEGRAVNGPVVKSASGVNSAPPKPFSQELLDLLTKGLVLSGAASVAATRLNNEYATPIRTVFMIITTFAGYVWGARLPAGFVKVVHPLVTSTIVTHIITQLCAIATGETFNNVLATYKSGSMAFKAAGAGDILLYLLGPSVVSFAISMYSRKNVIAENLLVVCTAMIVGSVGGLFGTALMVRLLAIGGAAGAVLRKSLLPRNITTPLAIPITKILNGDIPLACVFVVLTGIYGGTYGRGFMDSIGIADPVARGLGIGASAQGLGVASMTSEKEAFPFAAISMVLTAVAATVLVSIPSIKDTIVHVATGN